jgi:hypothetical protein
MLPIVTERGAQLPLSAIATSASSTAVLKSENARLSGWVLSTSAAATSFQSSAMRRRP